MLLTHYITLRHGLLGTATGHGNEGVFLPYPLMGGSKYSGRCTLPYIDWFDSQEGQLRWDIVDVIRH